MGRCWHQHLSRTVLAAPETLATVAPDWHCADCGVEMGPRPRCATCRWAEDAGCLSGGPRTLHCTRADAASFDAEMKAEYEVEGWPSEDDNEMYVAGWLGVAPSFGCVMHEPKPEDAP